MPAGSSCRALLPSISPYRAGSLLAPKGAHRCLSAIALLRRLRKAQIVAPRMSAAATTPATTPPAMAPLLLDDFVVVALVVVVSVTVAPGADAVCWSAVVELAWVVVVAVPAGVLVLTADKDAAAEVLDVAAPGLAVVV